MRLSQMLLNLFITCEFHLIEIEGPHAEFCAPQDFFRVGAKDSFELSSFDLLWSAICQDVFVSCGITSGSKLAACAIHDTLKLRSSSRIPALLLL